MTGGMNVVVVEGKRKTIKRYEKLMMTRINLEKRKRRRMVQISVGWFGKEVF